ncbi:hypothetical protein [Nocardia sp. NPDC024068]|uniref:hypothetical protein n=1 Tax=Nocardia sp. NPDC024068 TaxID=3157197 RepID=UPI0033D54537
MAQEFIQDPDVQRRRAGANRAASDPAYARAVGDPEWLAGFEAQFGKAANVFKVLDAERHMKDRAVGWTGIGDDLNTNGDHSDAAGTTIETMDIDGYQHIRRSYPEA